MSPDSAENVREALLHYVTAAAPSAVLLQHQASKTSEESHQARFQASGEQAPGAKALLVKLDIRERPDVYALLVLPGFNRLDSKTVRNELKQRIAGFRDFRFATQEEMARVARGLQPGKMPPFGRPLFSDIAYTFVDETLFTYQRIGFNAADFESSIIMDSAEYRTLVENDGIFTFSLSSDV